MNITLKDVKKQKVTWHLTSNDVDVIHQQYPGLIKITLIKTIIFICPRMKNDYLFCRS